ncbi:hypothetical protein CFIMG_003414RA [Ceratocystis fimbriata CBS 114723]|uniref:Uncharacterized protein n=1 Tax=Ceratocystis fimbriata CBS 114723 TaxID=1035309 RepID=A0A2C5WXD6_9PEZI|nr:hypothetical protein CFIMG_003414RA [Ceratocystis fimbriata CBS 114723]
MGFFRFLRRDQPSTPASAAAISSEQYFKGLAAKETSNDKAAVGVGHGIKHSNKDTAGDQLLPRLKLNLHQKHDTADEALSLPSPPSAHLSFDVASRAATSPVASSFLWRTSSISRPMSRKSKRFSAASIANIEKVPPIVNEKMLNETGPVFDNHPAVKPLVGPLSSPVASQNHQRNNSTFSSAQRTSRAFVDILDAQSVIKHSNLLSRVQATGVRDYGEDVADRNNAGNSFAISSIRPSNHLVVPGPGIRPSSSRENRTGRKRSTSMGSSKLRPATAISSRDRRAVSDYTVSDSASVISQHRLTAFHSAQRPSSPSSSPWKTSRPWARDVVDPSQLDMSSQSTRSSSPSMVNRVRAWSQGSHYDYVVSEKLKGKLPRRDAGQISMPSDIPSQSRDFVYRPSTPDNFVELRGASGNLVESITAGFQSIDVRDSFEEELPESSAAPSPQVLRRNRRIEHSPPLGYNAHSANGHECDLEESSRSHSSATRHWSVSSTTPTSSSLHSGSAPRPRTSYTENTSIELSASPDQRILAAILPRHSSRDATSAYYMQQAQSGALKNSPIPPHGILTRKSSIGSTYMHENGIDLERPSTRSKLDKKNLDQIASEVYATEESLLFRDNGFGPVGLQLPGLFETIPEISSDSPHRRSSMKSIQSSHYSHGSTMARTRCHQPVIPETTFEHFADFDYEHDPFPPLPPYPIKMPSRAAR